MQTTSDALAAAIGQLEQTLAPPQIQTDWAGDGYDGDGTIDDLTNQAGQPITVEHTLDDGLPDEVTTIDGLGTATCEAPLVEGRDGLTATRYFSPFNTNSPIAAYPRDGRPLTIDAGYLTADGPERVRLFTGITQDTPVTLTGSKLLGMSAARVALSKLVQPPVSSRGAGVSADWAICYTLHQCGYEIVPPARDGCVYWAPMCGSVTPWISRGDNRRINAGPETNGNPLTSTLFTDGPHRQAAYAYATTSRYATVSFSPDISDWSKLITQENNSGRIELLIRGDTATVPAAVAGYGLLLVRYQPGTPVAGNLRIVFGIDTSRNLYLTLNDEHQTVTLTHPTPLPTDGNWHSIGCAWDFAANQMWVQLDNDLQNTTPGSPLQTDLLPTGEADYSLETPAFRSVLPCSGFQVTATPADTTPTADDWVSPAPFTPDADIDQSLLELAIVAETHPREAWEYLGSLAKAELATFREDETGRVSYRTRGYWTTEQAQTVQTTLSTRTNVKDLAVVQDISRIRNVVNIKYSEVAYAGSFSTVWTSQRNDLLGPYQTLQIPVVFTQPVSILDAAYLGPPPLPGFPYVNMNSEPFGTGDVVTDSDVQLSLLDIAAGSATIQLRNLTGRNWYLYPGTGNSIELSGLAVEITTGSVSARHERSVATRGERVLDISVLALQSKTAALDFARQLVLQLHDPRAMIRDVKIIADPRLQPGDLIEFEDAANTDADGQWRITNIRHELGTGYEQTVSVRATAPLAQWGTAKWDHNLWKAGAR